MPAAVAAPVQVLIQRDDVDGRRVFGLVSDVGNREGRIANLDAAALALQGMKPQDFRERDRPVLAGQAGQVLAGALLAAAERVPAQDGVAEAALNLVQQALAGGFQPEIAEALAGDPAVNLRDAIQQVRSEEAPPTLTVE